ncbi:MAG: TlpA disulfide reductase family protein [Chlamydiota bacterium]
MKWHFSLAALSLAVLLAPASLTAELTAGAKAPGFIESLCGSGGLTGGQFNLSRDGGGRVVYLQFNNPTCPRCRFLIKTVESSVYPLFRDNPGVVFVQVAYAYGGYGVSDVMAMIAATGCTQNVLAEGDGFAYSAYDITHIPYSFIIDRDGVIQYSKGGMDIPASEITGEINGLLGGGPLPTPHPCIELICDRASYVPGDTVKIEAEVSGVSRPFDAYALIRQPDGSYHSMSLSGGLLPGVAPLAVNVPSHMPLASYSLLNTPIPLTAPLGAYDVIVGLADPGTLSAFCEAQLTEEVR